ncbi:MAG: ORF6N domain-containing protein [Candidatus Peribacteraceae bacterium]|nr:ORF6N domain-containing protein [Candidatus Peribacteraceae bacterium]
MTASSLIPIETIGTRILLIRGQKVMLDTDLAELYRVPVKTLNQAVRRNKKRFPKDFVFQLTRQEMSHSSRSQIVTLKRGHNIKYRQFAFTEQGVAMLSSVLHSPRAIQVNIAIMRAFVQLRQWLSSHADLARKLEEMEQRYDENFRTIFEAIRALMTPEVPEKKGTIGFRLE